MAVIASGGVPVVRLTGLPASRAKWIHHQRAWINQGSIPVSLARGASDFYFVEADDQKHRAADRRPG
jgi:hypothetical protein